MPQGLGSRTANATRTAQGTEDVTFTLPNNADAIILGTGLNDNNGDRLRAGEGASTIQFRTGGDGFTNVLSGSGAVRSSTATDLTDDGALTSGERLSTGTGGGSYIDGMEVEDASAEQDEFRDVDEDYTEWQWGLDFSNAVTQRAS